MEVVSLDDKSATRFYYEEASSSDIFVNYSFSFNDLSDAILLEDNISDEAALSSLIEKELLESTEYAMVMDMLIYGAKQADEVKEIVETLTYAEQQEFKNITYETLKASYGPGSLDNLYIIVGENSFTVQFETPSLIVKLGKKFNIKFYLTIAFDVNIDMQLYHNVICKKLVCKEI